MDSHTDIKFTPEQDPPLLAMVVAMSANRLIGIDGGLPWQLPDDMAWFRHVTMGKPVIMGRKTYDSIPARFRPLPGRHNIVITSNKTYHAPGATVVHSPEEAVAAAGDVPEIIIAGGAAVYRHFLPQADRLYLTAIDVTLPGDTFFPELDAAAWREVVCFENEADAHHPFRFSWLVLERNQPNDGAG